MQSVRSAHIAREPEARALPAYLRAARLERALDTPDIADLFAPARLVAEDEEERFPEAACRALEEQGFHHVYVPARLGGGHRDHEELLALLRVVARRDLTVAIGHTKTFLGSVAVWLFGGPAMERSRLAARVLRGDAVALALTERAHGGDLVACETRARASDGGFVLDGEKWLVNNATRSSALTVLARTGEEEARGGTLMLVEKDALDPSSFAHLPKVRTLGIRGADISGVRFDGARLPASAVIGRTGAGLELTLRALQVTRTLCSGLSLGAADTALRYVLRFASRRRVYGGTVADIPVARRTLARAFARLLVCDAASIGAARALHTDPGEMAVVSAIVKYEVPVAVEGILRDLAVVLGARHYVREDFMGGAFQKIERDARLVSLFDGSTAVNLSALAREAAVGAAAAASWARRGSPTDRFDAVRRRFRLATPLPPFRAEALVLAAGGRDTTVHALAAVARELDAGRFAADLAPGTRSALARGVAALASEADALLTAAASLAARGGAPHAAPPEAFDVARRYAAVHASAAAVHLFRHNRGELDRFFDEGAWLLVALDAVLGELRPGRRPLGEPAHEAAVHAELVRRHHAEELFSAVPTPAPMRFAWDA